MNEIANSLTSCPGAAPVLGSQARGTASAMRILMVTARFLPEMGGIETHVAEVATRLDANGYNVTVLTTDRSGRLPSSEVMAGVPVRRVRAWPAESDFYFAPGLFQTILAHDCDLIHIQGCHTLVPPIAMLAALAKRVPYVVTFHSGGHSSALRNSIRSSQWRFLAPIFRRAAAWIGVSRYEADSFSRQMGLDRERVRVILNGAAMPSVADPAPDAGLSIVSIGRLEKYKGHHRAIRVFAEVLKRRPGAVLRIVGDGPYRKDLETLVQSLGLSDKVIIGGVPPKDRQVMSRIISSASLVMLLSEYEANPVAVMEALALERPVLATNCTGFIELAEQSLINVVDPNASEVEIADAVDRLLSDQTPRERFVLPDWEECAQQVASVFESVVREANP